MVLVSLWIEGKVPELMFFPRKWEEVEGEAVVLSEPGG